MHRRKKEIKTLLTTSASVIDRPGHCHTADDHEELHPRWEGNVSRVAVGACLEWGELSRGRGLLPPLLRWEARDSVGARLSTAGSAGPSARTKEHWPPPDKGEQTRKAGIREKP